MAHELVRRVLLLCLLPDTARTFHVTAGGLVRLRASPPRLSADGPGDETPTPTMTWQQQLERILSPSTASGDREVLLRDFVGRGQEIAGDVTAAVSTGDLKSLVPPESEGGRVLDDLETVKRQVVDDLLPQATDMAQSLISDPAAAATKLQESLQRAPNLAQDAAQVSSALLQDPAKLASLVQQEARNVVSRTPEGMELASYRVLSRAGAYEVRKYESRSVALTDLGAGATSSVESEGSIRGFNSLVAYVLGANAGAEQLEWTAPVRTDVSDNGFGELVEMSVMLPSRYTASTAPAPSDGAVLLRQTEEQTVAVVEFSGLATLGEVQRQLSALKAAISQDDLEIDEYGGYSLLQYNPPYTLPWLRRNEIAVPVLVREGEAEGAGVAAAAKDEERKEGEDEEAVNAEMINEEQEADADAWLDAPSD